MRSCTISIGSSSQFTGTTLAWIFLCFAEGACQFLPILVLNQKPLPSAVCWHSKTWDIWSRCYLQENPKRCDSHRLWSHVKTTMDSRKPTHHCETNSLERISQTRKNNQQRELLPLLPFTWSYTHLYTETIYSSPMLQMVTAAMKLKDVSSLE